MNASGTEGRFIRTSDDVQLDFLIRPGRGRNFRMNRLAGSCATPINYPTYQVMGAGKEHTASSVSRAFIGLIVIGIISQIQCWKY